MKLKNILAAALLALGCTAFAQTPEAIEEEQSLGYRPQPYTFIQVQGGVGNVYGEPKTFLKNIFPMGSVAVGRMFSPIVGARLHVSGIQTKCGFRDINDKYKFKFVTTNADLMLNIINIFSKTNKHPIDLYLIGGIGLAYAWDNKEFQNVLAANPFYPNLEWGEGTTRKSLLSHNIRAGILADFNISKNWSVGLEVDANSLDDRFNSKYNNADDWMLTGQLSVTYKFGHKAARAFAAPVAPVVQEKKKEVAPVAPAAIVDQPINEVLFFQIRETETAENKEAILNKVVDWCKAHPNRTVTVDGYADRGTGNPEINVGYAEKRAQNIAAALKAKGVPASQLKVASHGDTVQPYAENDKNRCVIIVGK